MPTGNHSFAEFPHQAVVDSSVMPLSPATISDLRQELERLMRLRVSVDSRVSAIEAILAPFEADSINGNKSATTTIATVSPIRIREVSDPSYVSTGLRAAILEVLKKHGPSRAPAVSKTIAAQGFQNDSSTPLTTRVYNDLWRLSKKGVVEMENGIFSLKEAS